MVELLELPGAGRLVSGAFWVLRAPYRWTRDYVGGLIVRPDVLNLSEQWVLSAALTGWLGRLQAAPRRRSGTHPIRKGSAHGCDARLAAQHGERWQTELRDVEPAARDRRATAG